MKRTMLWIGVGLCILGIAVLPFFVSVAPGWSRLGAVSLIVLPLGALLYWQLRRLRAR